MFPQVIDHLELYVFNAFQSANFYRSAFGFEILAYAGPETGMREKVSYILKQGSVKLVISSAIGSESSIINHVINHDDGVKDVVFLSDKVSDLFEHSIKSGAIPIMPPTEINDGNRKIIKATISAFGDVVHSFIEKQADQDILPYYKPIKRRQSIQIFDSIDHLAIAIELNGITVQRRFYESVFNFCFFYSEEVDLGRSGMKSIVMTNQSREIKLVFVEPISKQEKSQIENYLYHNRGAGIQHIAFLSNNIISAVDYIKSQGINFLEVPSSYYEDLPEFIKKKLGRDKIQELKSLNILVDGSEDEDATKILLQVFTQPMQNRPTFFTEIIQRDKAEGFGSNNIKALYRAVQKSQGN